MTYDAQAATSFLATAGRQLDRRRLALLLGGDDAAGVVAALDGYRNPDGGYGWGLEPDLRSPESQPTAAMHAFEVLAEVGDAGGDRAAELCDWVAAHAFDDGSLPFVLPITDPSGCAPWWVAGDPAVPTLTMTAQVAANAHRIPAIADHPWLATATEWCVRAVRDLDEIGAYDLVFALHLADAAPAAAGMVDDLRRHVPADGVVPVAGGVEGEAVRPLDLSPHPGSPSRALFTDAVIADDLDRLAGLQQPDGGWIVDFPSSSPAGALEWRGYATVGAIEVLRANGC